jgi:hypothetical protein
VKARIAKIIVIALFIGVVIWLLCSCGAMTVASKPVVATQIAFDKNTQNAGLIDCDNNGCLVTSGWMAKHKAMETDLKQPLAADANIKPVGSNFRVSFEVQNHYAEMRSAQRGP